MSVLFVDGVDHYVTAQIDRKWDGGHGAGATTVDTTNPRWGGSQHLKLVPSSSVAYVQRILPSTPGTVVIGFAMKFDDTFPASHLAFQLRRLGDPTCSVIVNADGSVSVRRGAYDGTLLGSSAAAAVAENTWMYFEMKIVVHDSAGSYEIRINESVILSGSSVDTQGASTANVDAVKLNGFTSGAANVFIDDIYIDDSDFLGDCRVDTLFPDGAGNYAQWTPAPSGSSNYENVDESPTMDDDTTYNTTGVANEIDSHNFDALESLTDATIHAVALSLAARKDDAGARTLRAICRISSTDYNGTTVGIFDSYRCFQEIWENPPSDPSIAWTESQVNAAEFGVELIS